MASYYTFRQFPTKELDEFIEAFIEGRSESKTKAILPYLEAEVARTQTLPTKPTRTFLEDSEAWIQCERNQEYQRWAQTDLRTAKEALTILKTYYEKLQVEQEDKKIKKIAKEVVEYCLRNLKSALAPKAGDISEDANSIGSHFLTRLGKSIVPIALDKERIAPTTEQWKILFTSLKPQIIETELQGLYEEMRINEKQRTEARKQCIAYLAQIKNLLQTSLEHNWDIVFTNGLYTWHKNDEPLFKKRKKKEYIQKIEDAFSSKRKAISRIVSAE